MPSKYFWKNKRFIWLIVGILFLSNCQDSKPSQITKAKNIQDSLPDTQPQSRLPQKTKLWHDLMSVEYEVKGVQGNIPNFSQIQEKYSSKTIQLEGYMYPIEESKSQTFFMLTYFPTDACFFCGGAGPESVVEVNSPQGIGLSTKLITVEGRLELNHQDSQRLFYQLQDARQIK